MRERLLDVVVIKLRFRIHSSVQEKPEGAIKKVINSDYSWKLINFFSSSSSFSSFIKVHSHIVITIIIIILLLLSSSTSSTVVI